jgi:hypothetical protein
MILTILALTLGAAPSNETNGVEAVVPGDALAVLRVHDPAGLLSGDRKGPWLSLLSDARWLAPFGEGEPASALEGPELPSQLRELLLHADDLSLSMGGDPATDRGYLALALTGPPTLAIQARRFIQQLDPTAQSDPTGLASILIGIQNVYHVGEGRFLMVRSGSGSQPLEILGRMMAAQDQRTNIFQVEGLAQEHRGEDFEILLDLAQTWKNGLPATDPDFASMRQELEATAAAMTWAHISGGVNSAGHWDLRGVLPYPEDRLIGEFLRLLRPLSWPGLYHVPGKATGALAMSMDLEGLFDFMIKNSQTLFAMETKETQEDMREFEEDLGVRFREDFIALIGPEMHYFEMVTWTQAKEGEEPVSKEDFVFTLQVKDPKGLQRSMQALAPAIGLSPISPTKAPYGQWSLSFLWSEYAIGIGPHNLILAKNESALSKCMELELKHQASDSFAAAPILKSLDQPLGGSLMQASKDEPHSEVMDFILEIGLSSTGFEGTALENPIQYWFLIFKDLWIGHSPHWGVIDLRAGAGRLELRAFSRRPR